MRRLLLIVLGALLLLAACRKEARLVDLTAILVDQPARGGAKVYIDDDRYACWHNGDYVNVNGNEYTLSVEPGTGNHAGHKVAKILEVDESSNGYTAGYPTGCISGITEGGTTATATVLSVQPYIRATVYDGTGDSYQQLLNPMIGHCESEDEVLKFHNVACVLKVVVKNRSGYDLNVHYATLTAEDAFLAGSASVDGIGTDAPSMEAPTSGHHDITMDCNSTPIALNDDEDTVIYVVSAPFENQDLTLRVLAKDPDAALHGDTVYYTLVGHSASPLSLGRNQMGVVEFEVSDCGCAAETGRCDYLFWGCGTETNPFLITSYDDLNRMRNIVNYKSPYNSSDFQTTYNTNSIYYRQILDIDIAVGSGLSNHNWCKSSYPSIGKNPSYPFKGHYDGAGNSVTNMCSTSIDSLPNGLAVGFFGYADGAQISNLTVSGSLKNTFSKPNTRRIHMGGIVGAAISHSVVVSNCTSAVDIAVKYSTSTAIAHANVGVGGIMGQAEVACTVSNCYATSVISHNDYVYNGSLGGILGRNAAITGTYISGCTFAGQLIAGNYASQSWGALGGIVGRAVGASTTIDDCHNSGTISSMHNSTQTFGIGGIMGMAEIGTANILTTITNCTNDIGGIVLLSDAAKAGKAAGIMAYSKGSTSYAARVSISNCTNAGTVRGATGSQASYYTVAGGIFGCCTNGTVDISSCHNTGTVSGTQYVGGIVGRHYSNAKMTVNGSCSNSGTVSGTTMVGGIVGGSNYYTMEIDGCSNTKPVSSSSDYCGGILGRGNTSSSTYTITVKNCTNSAAISGARYVGGIVAGHSYGSIVMTDNTNSGTVTGTQYVGGIIGIFGSTDILTMSDCVNTSIATIKGNSYVGGILGAGRKVHITDCNNEAAIQNNSSSSGIEMGGIVGQLDNDFNGAYIDHCVNSGDITSGKTGGEGHLGGIVGRLYNGAAVTCTIRNCTNTGDINGTVNSTSCIGGLVGLKYYSSSYKSVLYVYNCRVENCTLTGGEYTCGLLGKDGYSPTAINNYLYNSYFGGRLNTGSSRYCADIAAVRSGKSYFVEEYCYADVGCYMGSGTRSFFVYSATSYEPIPPTDCAYYDGSSGTLYGDNAGSTPTSVSIGGTQTNLGDALRAWQAANSSYTAWNTGNVPTLQ